MVFLPQFKISPSISKIIFKGGFNYLIKIKLSLKIER